MNDLPEQVRAALLALARVLAGIDDYETADAWVEDLIVAAEHVIIATTPETATA